jgi:hypothetical protein
LDFQGSDRYLVIVRRNIPPNPMSNYKPTQPKAQVPDLLAALTAHGLIGHYPMAHENRPQAALPSTRARRSRLARWLEQRPTRHDPAPTSLDDEPCSTPL